MPVKRGRGRPRKDDSDKSDIRDRLVRQGIEILTEKGFASMGLEELLRSAGVPKGSFYYYFQSKEEYGLSVIRGYGAYFAKRLDRCLLNENATPIQRLQDFVAQAEEGMTRHDFKRGCLAGNMGQELGATHEPFRQALEEIFQDWQSRVAACLEAAKTGGEIAGSADCAALAAFFWIGWEGAVLRAKLVRSTEPLRLFADAFFHTLPKP